ncbi:lmo0937 family membrane protein [Longimicrobium sp.]|uniref:lmo0937 family membrane protein n=1 Tax=Longimicrobium sp. TaxID=2029185 RepID=UPI002BF4AC73|nr:lmo0937 family membrane protein [Longimicrobium sp.]HSU17049.1 lmo0937 family membrane protein [Longimicrobium sp.]
MRGLMMLAVVLVVLWVVGVLFFKIVGFAIHLLLIAGIILLILAVVRRGANAVRRRV